jgi:hypothetical protein
MKRNFKHQTPSTKETSNFKHQPATEAVDLEFEIWSFFEAWNLVLGA